ncbi:MAG TPA: hypothetical protein VHB98_11690 [Chloroflexota bacterium]|nr:hypothetical protein [Chloroflexota bacterium]
MDQININPAQPPASGPPPRQPVRWWPIALFLVIIAIILIVFAARQVARNNSATATATPSAVSTAPAVVSTVTAAPGAATNTAIPAAGASTNTPAVTSTQAQPPTNPTALRVISGTCTAHRITWTWSGARRATSYEVVLYDPRTGATIKDLTVTGTSYTLPAGPGATVALKVRARNAAGTGQGYFTPGSVGHVPPITTNPTQLSAVVAKQTITWFWGGAQHATAYDFVLYHYQGGGAVVDVTGRVDHPHWAIKVTPGITYYLKVRSVGPCAPAGYFTPHLSAKAG